MTDLLPIIFTAVVLTLILSYLRRTNRLLAVRIIGLLAFVAIMTYAWITNSLLVPSFVIGLIVLLLSDNFSWMRHKKS